MAYRIDYDKTGTRKRIEPAKSRIAVYTAAFFLLFLLLVNLFWPDGTGFLRQSLIPGDPDVTAAAVDSLIDDLKDGQQVSDAITAFCRELISNAENAD